MLGVLSSIRHPLKMLVFGGCGEMLQKSPKPIRESFAPYKEGPAQNVPAWSAHGRRRGARGLIPGFGLRPDHVSTLGPLFFSEVACFFGILGPLFFRGGMGFLAFWVHCFSEVVWWVHCFSEVVWCFRHMLFSEVVCCFDICCFSEVVCLFSHTDRLLFGG